jgi:methylenetetrahydrofolate reductase (NADPH)
MNRLAKAMMTGNLIVTAECLPPRGSDYHEIEALASSLPENLDAAVIADNPDAIRGSAFSAAVMLARKGRCAVLSMATRDRNRLALLSDALGAAALNVAAILCTSGAHACSVCPQAATAYDLDSVQFTQAVKRIVLYGAGMNGKPLEPGLDLQVGATAHPYLRPIELNLLRLKKKIIAGADFLLTQPVFDLDGFSLWMRSVESKDFDKRSAIIPSVLPITSLKRARALQDSQIYGPIPEEVIGRIGKARDEAAEGLAIAAETAMRLQGMRGVRGIHILCGGCESTDERIRAVRHLTAALKS